MADLMGAAYLKRKLEDKRHRVLLRYKYYDMKNGVRYFSGLIPESMRWMVSSLGWCGKAVDVLADRLDVREFERSTDLFDMNTIYENNNADILFDSAILSALISSCCFIYISADEEGFPRLQVIDGANATGIIDPITNLLKEGYAVLERDKDDKAIMEAYFEPGKTTFFEEGKKPYSISYNVPYPLLVPVIYRPDAKRPFGHSRISRSCMHLQQSALRTVLRSEVSAEFYSFPQKYALGLDQTAEIDTIKATMSSFLAFTKDDDGDHPILGQFQQQSMSPHIEQLKMFAGLFAGEAELTTDDLGFATVNPSSAESIKASHENLRLKARKAQKQFSTGFINAGYLAACVRDDFPYLRRQVVDTKLRWYPLFEPDMSTVSLIGDGIIKLNNAIPGAITNRVLEDLTGFDLTMVEDAAETIGGE